MDEKKTYGQIVLDHAKENHQLEDDIIEYRRKMEPDVMSDIKRTIYAALHERIYDNRDFYVLLGLKIERIGQGVKPLVWARRSCPTPVYKQSVWKYHRNSGSLEFLWSIPDKILYYHILQNTQKYLNDPECADIAKFVVLMESGELLRWVKKENGEKEDAIIKINNEETAWSMN